MSGKKKNVLFMISSLYGGGAEKVCCLLASEMAKQHNVTIVYQVEKEKRYPVDPRCRLVMLPEARQYHLGPGNAPVNMMRRLLFVKRLKKELDVDAAVSLMVRMNTYNVLTKGRERVITSERANPKKFERAKLPWIRFLYAASDHVVFQSETVRSIFGRRVRKHSSIICNPVSVGCLADPVRKHRIVSVGRLAEQKNHRMLIRAFSVFRKDHPQYTLSIYGEGELEHDLKELIRELELEDCVFLHGNVGDVHEQIRDAEMFVLTSYFEGLSNALLECMMMGIACISTACEGSKDVIRDRENGLLIPIADEQALVRAMTCIAEDEDLRKGMEKEARKTAAESFTPEKVIKAWEQVVFVEKN